ncbi:MAG: DUF4223 family protein [Rickettsiales bacterium]|nr:DUF4223 family protein [Rickettsiales bacterium]
MKKLIIAGLMALSACTGLVSKDGGKTYDSFLLHPKISISALTH